MLELFQNTDFIRNMIEISIFVVGCLLKTYSHFKEKRTPNSIYCTIFLINNRR